MATITLNESSMELFGDIRLELNKLLDGNFSNSRGDTMMMIVKILKSLSRKQIKVYFSEIEKDIDYEMEQRYPIQFFHINKNAKERVNNEKFKESFDQVIDKVSQTLKIKPTDKTRLYISMINLVNYYLNEKYDQFKTDENMRIAKLYLTDVQLVRNVKIGDYDNGLEESEESKESEQENKEDNDSLDSNKDSKENYGKNSKKLKDLISEKDAEIGDPNVDQNETTGQHEQQMELFDEVQDEKPKEAIHSSLSELIKNSKENKEKLETGIKFDKKVETVELPKKNFGKGRATSVGKYHDESVVFSGVKEQIPDIVFSKVDENEFPNFLENRLHLLKVFVNPELHETFEKFVKEVDKDIKEFFQTGKYY